MKGPMPTPRRPFRFTIISVALIALLAVVASGAGVAATSASTVVAFTPTDDAETDSTDPSTTRGSKAEGRVDNDPVRRAYLRFDVSGLTASVSRATLKLYSRTAHTFGFEVRSTASTGWTEATLTHNDAPAPSATVTGTSGSIAAGTWEEVDVTPLVTGNGTVAFALTTTSVTNLPLAMKESGATLAPQLVVETSSSTTSPPPPPPDTTAPSMPATLSKTGSTEAQVSMSWSGSTDNVGVTGYGVYRDGALVGSTTTQTSYTVPGLACGKSYEFGVDARDAAGNRSARKLMTASTNACPAPAPPTADTTAPTMPATLTKTGSTATQVSMSWSASTDNVGVTGYNVYRNGTFVGSTTTQLSYTVGSLACGSSYEFAVEARDAANNKSARKLLNASTNACATAPAPDTTAPTMPATLTKTGSTETQVSLSWSASTDNVGVTGYNVYRNGTLVGSTTTQLSYTVGSLTCGSSYEFAVEARDAANNKSARKLLNASTNACPPAPAPPPSGSNLTFPVRAAFYYPWFPETWTVGGQHVKYHPTLGYYSSSDATVAQNHVRQLEYGGFQAAIASWWGPGTQSETTRLPLLLNTTASLGSSLKWSLYHEDEGSSNPSVASLQSDLSYIASNYASHASYARIGGKPVIFVYNANDSSCEVADRWKQASAGNWYVVLKLFPGYLNCANQPDSWHQYGPASAVQSHPPHSYNISPGFWLANEATPRLARDPLRWLQNVKDMVASGARWQLVTSFNEWGEGTATESATEWASASGYGTYLDALHNNGGSLPSPPPPSTDTTAPSAPGGLLATDATVSSLSFSWNASTDNVGVTGYGVYRDGVLVASTALRSHTLTGLACGRSYVITVDAYDAAGNRSAKSAGLTLATSACPVSDTQAPTAPGNLRTTTAGESSIAVAWNASTDNVGVAGYRLYKDGAFVTTTTALAFTFASLTCGTTYTFGADAYDAAGNVSSPRASLTTATTACPAPPSGGDPVVAVAGDIAGDGAGDSATAALLDALNPTAVLTAGDNVYNDGSASQFSQYYEPTWGRHKAKTYPTPGNHDYQTSGASGYFGYFGARAGPAGKGWYSVNIGAWHIIGLNSEVSHGATSEQVNWLKADLAASGARCVMALWHKPRFTAGNYSDMSSYQPFWDALYAANADVVINGHDHNYQRYVPLNPSGARDDARGLREFVVGTGGRSHYGIRADSRRESADGGTYGVLKLTLRATGYDWQFVPEAGKTFTDSGSGACH
jgi:chitodextrinase